MSVPDLPTDHWVLRTVRPGFSVRIARRVVAAQLVLATLTLGAVLLEITVGGGTLPLRDVLATLVGHGDSSSTFVIQELREPRALTGLFVGVAFGISGAIVQGLTRNPLGSPDVLGLSAGASVGAVLVLLATDGTTIGVTSGALAGGLLAAVAVYALAWRQGMHGDRLVLVGIALGYALAAVTSFLISRVGNMEALSATAWLAGSLNGRGWEHVRPVGLALLVLLPLVWILSRPLRALELAEETSATLGVSVERTRFALFVVATLLAAVATASAGPVAFIALMAPQAARRVTGAPGAGLVAAGLMGAVILLLADVASQVLLPDTDLPVGIVTGVIGGVYLASLIARRRGSA